MMTSAEVEEYVRQQIGERWAETNAHEVDLRTALVSPRRIKMINRTVRDGKIRDSVVEVWVVLEENLSGDGYMIFFDEDDGEFGLASRGFEADKHPVMCGYYGDFWTTFQGM